MPFKAENVMHQKQRLIRMWLSGDFYITELCKSFGISTRTGHNIINQYNDFRIDFFNPKFKSPNSTPHKTPAVVEEKRI